MAKVGCSFGMTVHMGPLQNNEYIKITVDVSDVDTEIPFEEQLEKIHETTHQLIAWQGDVVADKIMQKWQGE